MIDYLKTIINFVQVTDYLINERSSFVSTITSNNVYLTHIDQISFGLDIMSTIYRKLKKKWIKFNKYTPDLFPGPQCYLLSCGYHVLHEMYEERFHHIYGYG